MYLTEIRGRHVEEVLHYSAVSPDGSGSPGTLSPGSTSPPVSPKQRDLAPFPTAETTQTGTKEARSNSANLMIVYSHMNEVNMLRLVNVARKVIAQRKRNKRIVPSRFAPLFTPDDDDDIATKTRSLRWKQERALQRQEKVQLCKQQARSARNSMGKLKVKGSNEQIALLPGVLLDLPQSWEDHHPGGAWGHGSAAI